MTLNLIVSIATVNILMQRTRCQYPAMIPAPMPQPPPMPLPPPPMPMPPPPFPPGIPPQSPGYPLPQVPPPYYPYQEVVYRKRRKHRRSHNHDSNDDSDSEYNSESCECEINACDQCTYVIEVYKRRCCQPFCDSCVAAAAASNPSQGIVLVPYPYPLVINSKHTPPASNGKGQDNPAPEPGADTPAAAKLIKPSHIIPPAKPPLETEKKTSTENSSRKITILKHKKYSLKTKKQKESAEGKKHTESLETESSKRESTENESHPKEESSEKKNKKERYYQKIVIKEKSPESTTSKEVLRSSVDTNNKPALNLEVDAEILRSLIESRNKQKTEETTEFNYYQEMERLRKTMKTAISPSNMEVDTNILKSMLESRNNKKTGVTPALEDFRDIVFKVPTKGNTKYVLTSLRKVKQDWMPKYGIVPIPDNVASNLMTQLRSMKMLQAHKGIQSLQSFTTISPPMDIIDKVYGHYK